MLKSRWMMEPKIFMCITYFQKPSKTLGFWQKPPWAKYQKTQGFSQPCYQDHMCVWIWIRQNEEILWHISLLTPTIERGGEVPPHIRFWILEESGARRCFCMPSRTSVWHLWNLMAVGIFFSYTYYVCDNAIHWFRSKVLIVRKFIENRVLNQFVDNNRQRMYNEKLYKTGLSYFQNPGFYAWFFF